QGAAGARHLVGGDLLAVAGAAQHDAEAAGIGDHLAGGVDTEGRVVVFRVVGVGAAVDHLVAGGRQVFGDDVLGLEAGVIRSQVDAHAGDSATCRRARDVRWRGTRWSQGRRPITMVPGAAPEASTNPLPL